MSVLIQGSAVLFGETGILIRGAPGSGKSSLAWQIVKAGGRLVSDDCVYLSEHFGRLLATAPTTIAGKLEIYGLGIVNLAYERQAILSLVVDLKDLESLERLPVEASEQILLQDVTMRRLTLPARSSLTADLLMGEIQHWSISNP